MAKLSEENTEVGLFTLRSGKLCNLDITQKQRLETSPEFRSLCFQHQRQEKEKKATLWYKGATFDAGIPSGHQFNFRPLRSDTALFNAREKSGRDSPRAWVPTTRVET